MRGLGETLAELEVRAKNFPDGLKGTTHEEVCANGWCDWFSSTASIGRATPALVKKALFVADSLGLDKTRFRVSFKNCCPLEGNFYNVIRLFSTDNDGMVIVTPRSGHTGHDGMAEVVINIGTDGMKYEELQCSSWSELKKELLNRKKTREDNEDA